MRTIVVRYKVKPDRVAENEEYIRRVFDELGEQAPSGFRYGSFKLEDGVSFVHVVFEEPLEEGFSLADLPTFQAFTANIADRCDEPPVASGATAIGSYRLVDG
jgi:hypothetical protein